MLDVVTVDGHDELFLGGLGAEGSRESLDLIPVKLGLLGQRVLEGGEVDADLWSSLEKRVQVLVCGVHENGV